MPKGVYPRTREIREILSRAHAGKERPWRRGVPILKMRNEGHPNWKGNSVSYNGLHKWVQRHLGRPEKCDHCGTSTARKYEWASISREYRRDLGDWVRLCVPCHWKYDDIPSKIWAKRRLNTVKQLTNANV